MDRATGYQIERPYPTEALFTIRDPQGSLLKGRGGKVRTFVSFGSAVRASNKEAERREMMADYAAEEFNRQRYHEAIGAYEGMDNHR